MDHSYRGACFCGAVKIRVTGQPNAMGYCHCSSCRSWSGGPVNAFSLWPPESVQVVTGEHSRELRQDRNEPPQILPHSAADSHDAHPPLNMVDVFAATIPTCVPAAGPRQLRRDRDADARRAAKAAATSRPSSAAQAPSFRNSPAQTGSADNHRSDTRDVGRPRQVVERRLDACTLHFNTLMHPAQASKGQRQWPSTAQLQHRPRAC